MIFERKGGLTYYIFYDIRQYVVFVNNSGDIVKKLVLLAACLLSIDVVANLAVLVDLPPAAGRVLARRLADVVVREGFSPLVAVASSMTSPHAQRKLLDGYRHRLAEKFSEEPHFISSYAYILKEEILLDTRVSSSQPQTSKAVHPLMVDMHNMIHTVARDYAEQQDGVVFVENDITAQLLEELEISLNTYWQSMSGDFRQMEGRIRDDALSQLYSKLINSIKNKNLQRLYSKLSDIYRHQRQEEDQAAASDMVEFFEYFPKLDQGLEVEEYRRMLQFASYERTTFKELDEELTEMLSLPREYFINPDETLALSNIINFSHTSFAMEGSRLTLDQGFTSRQKDIPHLDRELIENSLRANYRVALDQLSEERFLAGATAELLSSMGWTWGEFAQTIYPNDSENAALFVEDYHRLIHDTETRDDMIQGLRKEARIPEYRENNAINKFIAELPLLVEKERVMAVFSVTLQDDADLDNWHKLRRPFNDYRQDLTKWRTLSSKDFAGTIPSVATVIGLLQRGGLTGNQELASVFTQQVFRRLVLGQIVPEREINELRLRLSERNFEAVAEQTSFEENDPKFNVKWVLIYLMGKIMGKDDDEISRNKDEDALYSFYYMLPLIVQYDGFLKKIANGSRSNKNLHKALAAIEKDSMYYPLAVRLLRDLANKSRRDRNILLNKIRADINALVPINELISGNYTLPEETHSPAEEQAVEINRKS